MSASLVGSEMCIRDRDWETRPGTRGRGRQFAGSAGSAAPAASRGSGPAGPAPTAAGQAKSAA
eukprot:5448302-Alexandrium_andersonii.AAC.1